VTRLLVTGSSGFLGVNLALEAVEQGLEVVGVDRQRIHTTAFEQVEADLLAPGAVPRLLADTRPDWIVHCAALANLNACEADPDFAYRLNGNLPGLLAAGAADTGARIVHISTDSVFDGQDGGYTEDDLPNPIIVYSRTKLAGEESVAAANPQASIARVVFYGWSTSGTRSLGEFFYNKLSTGEPINGFSDVIFCPLLVNDLAAILLKILASDLTGLYHVVGSQAISKFAFGQEIARIFGFDPGLVNPVRMADAGLAVPRAPNLSLRSEKLATALGRPLPDVPTGLARFHALHQADWPQKLREMAA